MNIMLKYLNISLIFIFFSLSCSSKGGNNTPAKLSNEIIELQENLKKQEALLERLQSLIADQIIRNNDLEQIIPPRDLLESLQNGLIELKDKTKTLEKKVSLLQVNIEKNEIKKKETKALEGDLVLDQKKNILGLISLQSGNPNRAKEYWKEILSDKNGTTLKGEILIAIGNSYLIQGHEKQAASHYGIFLREFPKSPQVPQVLYYLGEAMGKLGEKEKQKILWKDLIEKFPKSNFSERAQNLITKKTK